MYNKMKGLDASSPSTFVAYTAEQTLLEQKVNDARKKRPDKKRRIVATVNLARRRAGADKKVLSGVDFVTLFDFASCKKLFDC